MLRWFVMTMSLLFAPVTVSAGERGTQGAGFHAAEPEQLTEHRSSAGQSSLSYAELEFLAQYDRYRAIQRAGMGLFGSGLGIALVGIAFTVIDPYGPLGLAGFITVGSGIAIMSSGMFVLGLSRTAWQDRLRDEFSGVVSQARGAIVGHCWRF